MAARIGCALLLLAAACGGGIPQDESGEADLTACPTTGDYCGADRVGGAANVLYHCGARGRLPTSSTACAYGCRVMPQGTNDVCNSGPVCPGAGGYCGQDGVQGGASGTLYQCPARGRAPSSAQACSYGCRVNPPGVPDVCQSAALSCANVQWWNAAITYGPYEDYNPGSGATYWWDTDLSVRSSSRVQLRHASKLIASGVYAWGWQPTFVDLATGKSFRFLHLRPQYRYAASVGATYAAGTVVGLSGGDTWDTGGAGRGYSSGPHLCVQTIAPYRSVFPAGQEACR